MKNELGRKVMTEFVALREKTYSYLTDDGSEDKKIKGTENYVIKKPLKLKIKKTFQKPLGLIIK